LFSDILTDTLHQRWWLSGCLVGVILPLRLSDDTRSAAANPGMLARAAEVSEAAFWILLAE